MLALTLALRYLFSHKSHNAINLITLVAACGVGVITAAMICMLSVYNGFEQLVGQLSSRFDPELRIEPTEGKTFSDSPLLRQAILSHPGVASLSPTLQETVLLSYSGRQLPAQLMGVDSTFAHVTQIDSILLGPEPFMLSDEVAQYCIPGAGLAASLGINRGFVRPLTVYCPRREGKIDLMQPDDAFRQATLYCSNVFMVEQADYDNQYLLCSIDVVRQLLADSLATTAYEVNLQPGADVDRVKQQLTEALRQTGTTPLRCLSQHEQQADAFRVMQIEKWITFLLVVFILLIASFNAIGALSMLIIDKEPQIRTLRCLGADHGLISRIFTFEGWLITGMGALGGVVLGVVLCYLQQQYGIISLGGGDTAHYVVSAYPVLLRGADVLVTIAAVALIGWFSTFYTVRSTIRR